MNKSQRLRWLQLQINGQTPTTQNYQNEMKLTETRCNQVCTYLKHNYNLK